MAHASDVLAELAQCAETDLAALTAILNCIETAGSPLSVFICDEVERMAGAARRIFERPELTDSALQQAG